VSNRSLTKTQALRRFTYVLERFGITKAQLGVTAHGLRHEFANRRLEHLGVVSPVRDGAEGQQPGQEEAAAKLIVSEELGHSRLDVTTAAYFGTNRRFASRGTLNSTAKARAAVLAGKDTLSDAELRELQALAREILSVG
jgi:integrase